jgi:hypothetical protein
MELVKNSCCPSQVSDIATCTWDLDTSALRSCQEAAEEKDLIDLERALWFQDIFAKLGTSVNGKLKTQAPPPKTLFIVNEDWSVKTVQHCHESAATTAGSTPPWKAQKGTGEIVDLANLDEDPASSSSIDGPCTAATIGADDSPPLVMRMTVRLQTWLMADSWHQLPSHIHGEGTAHSAKCGQLESRRKTSSKGNTTRGRHNYRRESMFRSRQSSQNILVIDLSMSTVIISVRCKKAHQSVLQALEHRTS